MGLDNIFHLSQSGNYSLKIILEDLNGNVEQVVYDNFKLLDQVRGKIQILNTHDYMIMALTVAEPFFRQFLYGPVV